MSTAALETVADVRRTRLELLLKVLDVEGAVRRVSGGWSSTGAGWTYDEERYGRVAEARDAEAASMLAYLRTEGCRMRFLQEALDDPGAADCGRCDRCAGAWFDPSVPDGAVQAATRTLRKVGVPVEPRSQWPSGMARLGVSRSGRIAADERVEEGRVVARLTDLGWGQRVRSLLAPDAPDGPADERLLAACVEVLAGWGWDTRPVAVVAMPSLRRPLLVASVAAPPGDAGPADRPRLPRRSPPTSRPAAPAATARSGWPPCTTGSRCSHRARRPAGRAGRAGAAGRRPGRLPVDRHGGRGRAPAGRRTRRAARSRWLSRPDPSGQPRRPEPRAAGRCRHGRETREDGDRISADREDADVLARVRGGDRDAYAELVHRHAPVAVRTAALLGAGPDAEDVVQEAFVKAYSALGRFREGAAFRPWLLQIVANETRNLHRSAGRRADRERSAWRLTEPLLLAVPAAEDPAATVVLRERRAELVRGLGQLSEPHRQVVTCRYLLELDEAETAAVLGWPRGTVKSRLHRALGAAVAARHWPTPRRGRPTTEVRRGS